MFLNEVKKPLHSCLPGYTAFRSSGENAHSGGTVVMVQNYLSKEVINVDTSTVDQVWMQMQCAPGIAFGFCYIPPSDSTYVSFLSFSAIQKRLLTVTAIIHYVLLVTLTLNLVSVQNLVSVSEMTNSGSYKCPCLSNEVVTPNENVHVLSSLCFGNGLPGVNNLQTSERYFPS